MTLIIDSREDPKMAKRFEKAEIAFEIAELPVGDYLFEDSNKTICIERKTIGDLIGSIKSGHMKKQLLQMENNYEKSFLVIVGDFKEVFFNPHLHFTVAQKIGFFSHIAIRYKNVRMVQVDNENQFVEMCKSLWEKSTDGKVLNSEMILHQNKKDPYLGLLASFAGISLEKAKAIKEKYPSFQSFLIALKGKKLDVKGIGKSLTERLETVLLS